MKQIYTDLIDEPEEFNRPLMEYLVWYNTERVHRSIGKVAPLRYYVDKFIACPKQSNMYWTPHNKRLTTLKRLIYYKSRMVSGENLGETSSL